MRAMLLYGALAAAMMTTSLDAQGRGNGKKAGGGAAVKGGSSAGEKTAASRAGLPGQVYEARQGRGPDHVPPGHLPPAGLCRIWIDGVPPGKQPAPTDCSTALARRPANARVIFGSETPFPGKGKSGNVDSRTAACSQQSAGTILGIPIPIGRDSVIEERCRASQKGRGKG